MFRLKRSRIDRELLMQNVYCIDQREDRKSKEEVQLEYLTFPMIEELGVVKHLISTRLGGVSEGDLGTMNLSFTRGDKEENVLENYRRIAQVLDCSVEDMVASHQTHTINIRKVTKEDKGKGILYPKDYEDVDGLITNVPGVVLVTYYADCVPLIFVDPVHKAIGLAHSGWRGTVNKMGKAVVDAMRVHFDSEPQDLYVAIGPSICRECYEVSEEVATQFMDLFGENTKQGDLSAKVVSEGKMPGKYQLDLWQANKKILLGAGVLQENIAVTDICTCCNSKYLFSHRASGGKRGNIGVFLMLKH